MLVQKVCSILVQGCHLVNTGTDCMDVNQLTTCVSKCANSYLLKNCVQPAGMLLLVPTILQYIIVYYSKYHNKTTHDMISICYLFLILEFCSYSMQIYICHAVMMYSRTTQEYNKWLILILQT